jgi:hypothetical protein
MGEAKERTTFRATRQSSWHGSCETHTFNRSEAQNRSSATSKVGTGQVTTSEKSSLNDGVPGTPSLPRRRYSLTVAAISAVPRLKGLVPFSEQAIFISI